MADFEYVLMALIGAGGGLISGAVGLAGGIFIVPALVALLGTQAMGDAVVVSFFAVLLNSLSATIENRKSRGADAYRALVNGAGCYTSRRGGCGADGRHPVRAASGRDIEGAARVAATAPGRLHAHPAPVVREPARGTNRLKDAAVGSIVGGVSTLIGVGGGTYTIFYFLVHGREIKDCTLTSNFVGIFIGLMGIVGYYGYALVSTGGSLVVGHGIMRWER